MPTDTQTVQQSQTLTKSRAVAKAAESVLSLTTSGESTESAREQGIRRGTLRPVIAKGKGAVVTDVDGNDYIDFALNQGSILLGHADERIVAAITKAASKGFGFSDPTEGQVRLAEMIAARFASVDKVFLTRSRARALATVMRLARATTGRKELLVAAGSMAEQVAQAIDSGSALLESNALTAQANHPATPHATAIDAADVAAWRRAFTENGSSVAAVVIEPFSVSSGLRPVEHETIAALRTLCLEHGALLIFDDCITALRVGAGGSEGVVGVTPDLTLIGSEIGGGLPLAAVGGRKDIMKDTAQIVGLCPWGDAPTDDLAIAAGIAVLQAIAEAGFYEALDELANHLAEGMSAVLTDAGRSIEMHRAGSLVGFTFPSESERSAGHGNDAVTHPFGLIDGLLKAGIMPPIDLRSPWSVSAAHTKEDVDGAVEALAAVIRANS